MKKFFLMITAALSMVPAFAGAVPQVTKKNFTPELRSCLRIRQGAFDTVSDLYLVTAPDGTQTLIDGGLGIHRGRPYYKNVLFKVLQEQKISHLDQIIITHPHSDHFGSIPFLLKRQDISVGKVCWAYLPPEVAQAGEPKWQDKPIQDEIIKLCRERKIPLIELKKGDTLAFGSGITAKILSTGARSAKHNFVNNQSLVFQLRYGKFTMLFTGDCGFAQENELLKEYGNSLRSTVLKCAHHGGSGSTGAKFLAAVAPQLITSPMPKWLSGRRQGQEVEARIRNNGASFIRSWEYPRLSIVSDGETFELVEITYL
ncbi:MAG: MBL fold metallo-hydrolase [Lentisphaeria bacterium]|nr:MBL fold metallo-hydrolase [Lentisphaeria bacterium]